MIAANLNNGKSTKDFCLARFGPPSKTSTADKNGELFLTWRTTDGYLLVAGFGKNNVMTEHIYGYGDGKTFYNMGRVQPAVR